MDITAQALLLAFGLGLLGFVEPCTIGAHMLFLGGQKKRRLGKRLSAALTFLLARLVVMGGFGGLIVMLGQRLIGVQTGAWLVFGALYLALGLLIFAGGDRAIRRRIMLSPEGWKLASNPVLQGLAYSSTLSTGAGSDAVPLSGA
ncbi:hypothetical protein LGT41_0015485 [Abyssibius alkaniclasticus]|uniref:hypothetical protein n=1 Tax=Abyssibius alkaniclasticus TaxID=2881234 RepID=UPI0023643430|nr:hypothetical protein [Abyssibius alkaniclasticus]UPH71161.1 hypothetical protein LGT41_0015485 [Abyssibius alkaniclasticus]|tara:strand:- start:2577 stop:3011 length:435 start_codon:yes stop_codon:yes gene_type:complete